MYDFAYHKPASVADAVKLLAADPDAQGRSPAGRRCCRR